MIAEFAGDDSPLFSYHMMAGVTIVFLIILRFIWGLIGTTYARFSSFKLNPLELVQYLKDTIVSKTKRYLSHNPASSYAILLMFIFAIGLAVTGILMTTGYENDFYEESHELLANLFLITVIAHVAGIIFHQFRHRDALWSSMLDGKKKEIPGKEGITNTRPVTGILFLFITVLWMGYLSNQYNGDNQTLNLFGNELQLGEEDHHSYESNSYFKDEEHEGENEHSD